MMFETIKKILTENGDLSAWNIKSESKESQELFFIGNALDMNRSKKITDFTVTVFRDFEDNGEKYRGSATVEITPSAKPEEVGKVILEASYAASFVKNKWYPIPRDIVSEKSSSESDETSAEEEIIKAVEEFYGENGFKDAKINSSEFFLTKYHTRIINSDGVDVNYCGDNLYIEMIVNSSSGGEEIELYDSMEFSAVIPGKISEKVRQEMYFATQRAIARPTPQIKKLPVILSGGAPGSLLYYYVDNTDCKSVYQKISDFKIGQSVCGENAEMNLNISIDPFIKGSAYSCPYDDDGLKLGKIDIIEDGTVKKYWGNMRYSHYLNREPSGELTNYSVIPGDVSVEDMRKGEYLEVEKFSDFYLESVTGEFGGEIRLGWYCDGETRIPVTGGSVTGNILEVQNNMIFSKETCQVERYSGPKHIKIKNVSIAGVE